MVTLNLTDAQAIMLHAAFINHLPEEIVGFINKDYDYYLEEEPYSPYAAAYKFIKQFIEANPENESFGEESINLFDELEGTVKDIGRERLKNERKAKLAKETNK